MPELPEVETVRVQLWAKLRGRTISKVIVHDLKTVGADLSFARKLRGLKFADIERVGKLLIFRFEDRPDRSLLGHLKMTGQFFYTERNALTAGGGHSLRTSEFKQLPDRHTRVSIETDAEGVLHFNDQRKFGFLKLADAAETAAAKRRFGPEPIAPHFDHKDFARKLRARKTNVKAALLDQTFVAGLGNIYVDETLFAAEVKPDRSAASLDEREALRIAKSAGAILKRAIKSGGTTFQHFMDAEGKRGGYVNKLKVFGRQGLSCPRCGATILKTRVAGRGTHFCPNCQK